MKNKYFEYWFNVPKSIAFIHTGISVILINFLFNLFFSGVSVGIDSYHLIFACECVWVHKLGCPQAKVVGGEKEACASEALRRAAPRMRSRSHPNANTGSCTFLKGKLLVHGKAQESTSRVQRKENWSGSGKKCHHRTKVWCYVSLTLE